MLMQFNKILADFGSDLDLKFIQIWPFWVKFQAS